VRLITEEGFTRIPVYQGSQDTIIGILHAKDLLKICSLAALENSPELTEVLNPPMIISESKPITDLLRDFQAKKNHMAIVTDEFGSVRGLITLEDVIEEIVGEIDDEHDQEERELMVVDGQTVVVDAKIDVEEVEAHFNCRLPEGPYESVGGLITHRLGRIPENGDSMAVEPLIFKVLAADARRARTVRIRKHMKT
jgi:CBS domain containing-hemolysin-like protein